MAEIKLEPAEGKYSAFNMYDGNTKVGEMVISISGNQLTVYHTEVNPAAEGKGYAKQLLEAMVIYARENKLAVIPLCPFVSAQFKRHPELYADLWREQLA